MKIIAKELNFTYTINLPKIKVYSEIRNNRWVGLVGEVYDKLYDFTIGDLSVTEARATVIFYQISLAIA